MRKVFVTGGSGFVGLAIVRRLLSQGKEVVVVGRRRSVDVEKAGARMIPGDIRDGGFLQRASHGCDAIFHVAAKAGVWGSWEDYHGINVLGTKNIIEACQKNKISTLVYTSTPSVVFSGKDIVGEAEDLPYAQKFLCHYAQTKCLAEKMVIAANDGFVRTVSLRPHLIWGPGDTNLIPRILSRARKGLLRQVGDGRNKVDISYIDNVVDAHIQAAMALESDGRPAGKAYFISQGEPVNLWGWLNGLLAELAIKPIDKKISFVTAYCLGAAMEGIYTVRRCQEEPMMTRFVAEQLAKSHWFSIENAHLDFGYSPRVSTADGMEKLIEFLKK